jgi:hypothetical protein
VVDLRQQGDAVAVEAADDVQLPQRTGAVERAGDDPGDLVGELAVRARGGQRELADVEVQVEVLVLDPVGMVDAERDLGELPREGARRWSRSPMSRQRSRAVRVPSGAVLGS